MLFNLVLPSLEYGLGQSSSVLQAIYAMKTAHMTQHPLSIFDAAYMGIDKILPK